MAVLKVKDPADPNRCNTWLDITGTGTQGPPAARSPSAATSVRSSRRPARRTWRSVGPSTPGSRTATWSPPSSRTPPRTHSWPITGSATIKPARMYQVFADQVHRCVGTALGVGQFQVAVGTVNLAGYDVVTSPDTGLWGAWSQSWVNPGSDFTATTAALDIRLNGMVNVAARPSTRPVVRDRVLMAAELPQLDWPIRVQGHDYAEVEQDTTPGRRRAGRRPLQLRARHPRGGPRLRDHRPHLHPGPHQHQRDRTAGRRVHPPGDRARPIHPRGRGDRDRHRQRVRGEPRRRRTRHHLTWPAST